MVRVEAGGQSEDFQDYMVCSFSPAESCCHFRRKFRNEDERLLKLMEEKRDLVRFLESLTGSTLPGR